MKKIAQQARREVVAYVAFVREREERKHSEGGGRCAAVKPKSAEFPSFASTTLCGVGDFQGGPPTLCEEPLGDVLEYLGHSKLAHPVAEVGLEDPEIPPPHAHLAQETRIKLNAH